MGKTNQQVAEAFIAGKEAENHRRTFYSKRHNPEDFNPFVWRVGERTTLYGPDNEGLIELWSYNMRLAIRFDSVYQFGPFELVGDVKRFPEIERPKPDQFDVWKKRMDELNVGRKAQDCLSFMKTPFILAVSPTTARYSLSTGQHWEAFMSASRDTALVFTCDRVTDAEHREQMYNKGYIYKRGGIGPRGGKQRPTPLFEEYRVKEWHTHRGYVNSNDVGEGWRMRS